MCFPRPSALLAEALAVCRCFPCPSGELELPELLQRNEPIPVARCAGPKAASLWLKPLSEWVGRSEGRGGDELLCTALSAWKGRCLPSLTLVLGTAHLPQKL